MSPTTEDRDRAEAGYRETKPSYMGGGAGWACLTVLVVLGIIAIGILALWFLL
jgi:hypothetical protein